jgi:hypothetical protein
MSKRPHTLQRLVAQPEEVPERESRVQCGYAQQKVAADLMYIRNEPRISKVAINFEYRAESPARPPLGFIRAVPECW